MSKEEQAMATTDPFNRGIGNFRGTRDYSGEEARWRQQAIDTIRRVFEAFGFEPLETPALETERTLKGKYGQEGEMRRFRINLPFPDEAGLRYDHTVPLARFMAMNWNQFPLPYRRYVIGPVFRNETVQAGRLRQFTQCDFDTVGSTSRIIDAEVVAMNSMVLSRLGFREGTYVVRVNDRKLLNAMSQAMAYSPEEAVPLFRCWDKLEKVAFPEAREGLIEDLVDLEELTRGKKYEKEERESAKSRLNQRLASRFDQVTEELFSICDYANANPDLVLGRLAALFEGSKEVRQAVNEMEILLNYISSMVSPDVYRFWPVLARGLDYYTGPIFETTVEVAEIGSITGGGRFDNLIQQMGGPDMPASGSSFGLERIMEVIEQLGLKPETSQTTQVFVTLFSLNDAALVRAAFELSTELRLTGVCVEVYTGEAQKLSKQIDIANRKSIPIVVIIGPDELGQNTVTIKEMRSGTQRVIPRAEVVGRIQALLNK